MAASGEAKFHVSGKVNKQNVHMWGTEKPHRIVENERDSPKTNVFCAISTSKVYGPYREWRNIPEHADYVAYVTTGT